MAMDLMDGMGRVNEIGLGGRRAECSFRARVARQTIPAPLRKMYGIKGGSRVAFEVTPSGVFLLKPVVR